MIRHDGYTMVEPTAAQIIEAIGGSIHTDVDECDVVIIGGSLLDYGAQNLIEAAAVGRASIVGPSTYNFEEAAREAIAVFFDDC